MHRRCPLRHLAHEGLVDLDRVEGEALQVGQRRIAGAEIVERQAGAEVAQARCSICAAYSGFSITRLSVISSLSEPGQDAGAGQHRLHVVQQVVAQQLAARHVDAGEDRRLDLERALPGRELAAGALEQRRRRD